MNVNKYLCPDTVSNVQTFVDLTNLDRAHRQELPRKVRTCIREMMGANLFYYGFHMEFPFDVHFEKDYNCMVLMFPYVSYHQDTYIGQITYVFKTIEERSKYRKMLNKPVNKKIRYMDDERNMRLCSRAYCSRTMNRKLYLLTRKCFC